LRRELVLILECYLSLEVEEEGNNQEDLLVNDRHSASSSIYHTDAFIPSSVPILTY
jgi:hypothetical protein